MKCTDKTNIARARGGQLTDEEQTALVDRLWSFCGNREAMTCAPLFKDELYFVLTNHQPFLHIVDLPLCKFIANSIIDMYVTDMVRAPLVYFYLHQAAKRGYKPDQGRIEKIKVARRHAVRLDDRINVAEADKLLIEYRLLNPLNGIDLK